MLRILKELKEQEISRTKVISKKDEHDDDFSGFPSRNFSICVFCVWVVYVILG